MSQTQTAPVTTMKPAIKATRPRKLFVNVQVRDLARSMDFFGALGFEYNQQFTDHTAAAMLVGEDAYFMLLTPDKFREFARKPVGDTRAAVTAFYAFSVDSRAEVDQIVSTALASGGAPADEPKDHGFMYQHSFYDLDGHHWEVFWMDPAVVQG